MSAISTEKSCNGQAKLAMPKTSKYCKFHPSMSISTRITQAREAKGLNQSELARALKVRPQTVQQWESGKTAPRRKRLKEFEGILGKSAEWFEFGDKIPDGIGPISAQTWELAYKIEMLPPGTRKAIEDLINNIVKNKK